MMRYAVIALLLWPGLALAQLVSFSGVLPNGALYQAPVQSMQQRRYANLVRQQTDYSCGAASLATILRYGYGLSWHRYQISVRVSGGAGAFIHSSSAAC